MHQYLNLLKFATDHGFYKGDRTKTGTKSIAGLVARYDLRGKKIAAVTTKKHAFKPGLVEEQWMLSGDTNVDFLKEHGCNIWDEWVFPNTATYRTRSVKEMQRQYTRDHHGWGKPKLMPTWLEPGTIVVPHYQGDSFNIVIAELNGMQSHMVIDKTARAASKSNWYNPEDPIWIEFYSAMGISDQEVVTGSLGSVYGKTFRDLEDTRIIKNIKAEEHIDMCKRGFTFEGTLAGERAVYTRRIDQVAALLKELAKDPDSRRLIICPWTPALLDEQALPPCHSFIQFWTRELTADERYALYVVKSKEDQELINQQAAEHPEEPLFGTYTQLAVLHKDVFRSDFRDPQSPIDEVALHTHMDTLEIPKRALTCLMYQRSGDAFIGIPYNLTFYSILTHKIANQFNMVGEELVHVVGDFHIYNNHQEQVALQLTREPLPAPTVKFNFPVGTHILDVDYKDIEICGYTSHPAILAPIAK